MTDVKPIDNVKKWDASLHRRIALAFDVDEHKWSRPNDWRFVVATNLVVELTDMIYQSIHDIINVKKELFS